jgi:DNA-directed RNA polymerase omega subunit
MYKLPENLESKYAFISLASARAEQLQSGAVPRVDPSSKKITVIAQQEVAEGAVQLYDPATEEVEFEEEEEEE